MVLNVLTYCLEQNRGVVSKAYKLAVEKIVMTQKWGWLCERGSEGERNRQLKRQERGGIERRKIRRGRERDVM